MATVQVANEVCRVSRAAVPAAARPGRGLQAASPRTNRRVVSCQAGKDAESAVLSRRSAAALMAVLLSAPPGVWRPKRCLDCAIVHSV
jgi:hypothetical protein